MKSGRWVLNVGVICCVLILHGLFTVPAPGEEPNAGGGPQAPARQPATAESSQGVPVIFFEKTNHDFGPVAPSSTNECEFEFENKGTGILEINDISKTCGCTVPTLEKKDYVPGEKGKIKVQFTIDRGSGPRTKELFVYSNDPNNPRVPLRVMASIAQKVAVEPERLEYTLKGENAGVAELTLRSIDEPPVPFAITKFESTADAVTADFDPNQRAEKFVLQTRIDAQKMGASSNGRIEIAITNPESPSLTIPFKLLQKYKVDPPAINVLNAEPGKAVQREVWLLNNYEDDFEVMLTSSREGIIKVVSQEKLGNRYKFSIEITPPEAKGAARMFTDTLSIGTKDGSTINVPCRGFYKRQ